MAKRDPRKKKGRKAEEADAAARDGAAVDSAAAEIAADVAPLEDRIAELEGELERARAEAAEAADRSLRTLAEFDNYRKRTRREGDEARRSGAAAVLSDVLVVADDFERALANVPDGVPASFLDGMNLVARAVTDLLQRHGISRIDAVGRPFDPEVHEALSSMPAGDAEPNSVVHEVQAGYVLGDRVLRPAKVIVAQAPEA